MPTTSYASEHASVDTDRIKKGSVVIGVNGTIMLVTSVYTNRISAVCLVDNFATRFRVGDYGTWPIDIFSPYYGTITIKSTT